MEDLINEFSNLQLVMNETQEEIYRQQNNISVLSMTLLDLHNSLITLTNTVTTIKTKLIYQRG